MRERSTDGRALVKEEVDEQDIADVVSRWTGVLVSKLLEGEVEVVPLGATSGGVGMRRRSPHRRRGQRRVEE